MIDLRSDTVTQPTKAMREAMYNAIVGDDVSKEDPTVNKLEQLAAEMLGKEDALFVPSGTFGNQLALFTHCERTDEVILPEHSHIVQYEAGAASVIAAVHLRTIRSDNEWFTWEQMKPAIRESYDIHCPKTGLVVLQNSTGRGAVMPLDEMAKIKNKLEKYKIPIHIDGARIFNAATHLGAGFVHKN